jgi:tol-pal system protein YbgF
MRLTSQKFGGAVALAGTVLLASGCATKGDLRNVQNELRSVRAGQEALVVALRTQAQITQDSLRGTTDQLFEIRGTVNQQLAQLLGEMRILREENAQNQRSMAAIRDQLEGLLRQIQMSGSPLIGQDGPVGGGSSAAIDLYNSAVRQFNLGNFVAARTGFSDIVQRYPNDELAPLAQFQLGEILVQEGSPQEAIAAFARIQEFYPAAPKVPEAMYRIGLLHRDAGRRDDARRILNMVVESYPGTPTAGMAADRLRELGPG